MLAILKENIPLQVKANIQVIETDFSNFSIPQKFSLIMLPCNTFCTLKSKNRLSTVKCIQNHLKPNGIFAVSIPNPAVMAKLESNDESEIESVFAHPTTGNPVQVSCDWVQSTDQVTLNWHYDHLKPNGNVERLTKTVHYYSKTTDKYLQNFARSGLKIQSTFGDFDRSPYTATSPHLIILAMKI
jgi:hypothetical protein